MEAREIRKKILFNGYMRSNYFKDEIIIKDHRYKVTDRVISRLRWRKIIMFVEVVAIAFLNNKLGIRSFLVDKMGEYTGGILSILLVMIMAYLLTYVSSYVIITEDLMKEITLIRE